MTLADIVERAEDLYNGEPPTVSDWLLAVNKQNIERQTRMIETAQMIGQSIVTALIEREMYQFHGNGD